MMRRLLTALVIAAMMTLPVAPVMAQSASAEVSFWESVRDSKVPAELEAYLTAYPKGKFAPLARIRLKLLKAGGTPKADETKAAATPPPVHECDRLAAHPWDPDKVAEGVTMKQINPEAATRACQDAVAAYPGVARFEYQLGRAFFKTKSYAEVLLHLRKAAKKGYAPAMDRLGVMYFKGYGVAKDDAEAIKWIRKAADKGYAIAMKNLGGMYKLGRGVEQDYGEAVKWARKAADKGYARAMFSLGYMYVKGDGVEQDYAEAVKWYRKAADKGHTVAMNNLGVMYENGQGVAKDMAEAVKWFRKAAEKGYARAMSNLGVMYENGQGVAQDYAVAVKWYRKAVAKGFEQAKKRLRDLGQDPVISKQGSSKPSSASDLGDLKDLGLSKLEDLGRLN